MFVLVCSGKSFFKPFEIVPVQQRSNETKMNDAELVLIILLQWLEDQHQIINQLMVFLQEKHPVTGRSTSLDFQSINYEYDWYVVPRMGGLNNMARWRV